jgi:UDP-N-acetylmuramate dehydrogenase
VKDNFLSGLQIHFFAESTWFMKGFESMNENAGDAAEQRIKELSRVRERFAQETRLDVCQETSVAELTTFGVGGKADLLVYARDAEELKRAVGFVQKNRIPFLVLGGGSNILINDQRLLGAVILARETKKQLGAITILAETEKSVQLSADATVSNARLLKLCIEKGCGEADYFAGIPGGVGGSIMGNAGTKYGSVSQIVTEVEIIDPESEIRRVEAKDIGFSYRASELAKQGIILRGFFKFSKVTDPGWKALLRKRMNERAKSQPIHQATAGCTFKNGSDYKAGQLIEELGLKGLRVGKAQVSETHANFIVNLGGAAFSDITQLIGEIKKAAKEERSIDLVEEIRIKEGI